MVFEPNPLSIFGLRRVDHCPPHFVCVDFDIHCDEKKISDWIWTNLRGRFWIGDHYVFQKNRTHGFAMVKRVGFEEPGESSFFSLHLDIINQNQ